MSKAQSLPLNKYGLTKTVGEKDKKAGSCNMGGIYHDGELVSVMETFCN